MNYTLKITEVDEIKKNNEFVKDNEDIELQNIKIEEDENIFKLIMPEKEIFPHDNEGYSVYKKVNNITKSIVLDKKTNRIINVKEIFEKWKSIKSQIMYDPSTANHIIDDLMSTYDYFENEQILNIALARYGLIPYLLNINLYNIQENHDKKKNLELYGILVKKAMLYDVHYKVDHSNEIERKQEISFEGQGDINTNVFSLKKEIRGIMNLPKEQEFFVNSSISGKYIFYNGLESMFIKINLLVDEMKNLKKYKFGEKVITIKLVRENNIEKELNNERII
jgi:hypothetical protein